MKKQFLILCSLTILVFISCKSEIEVEPKTKSQVLAGLEKSSTLGLYNIDGLKKNMLVELFEPYIIEDDITIVHGWAVDQLEKAPVKELWVAIDTFMFQIHDFKISRSDVAGHFNKPAYENVGFSGAIYTKGLGFDKEELSMVIINRDKGIYFPASQTKTVQFRVD